MKAYTVEPATRKDVDALVKRHYLGRWPGVTVATIGLLAEDRSRYIGVIVFALPPRETFKRYGVPLAWELARLFIEDGTPKNAETWFMARAIAWVKRNRPDVGVIVSYADPSFGHAGTIYKAGNWIEDGMTDDTRKTPRFDYRVAGKTYSRHAHIPPGAMIERVPRISKHRFIYWTKDHEKKRKKAASGGVLAAEGAKHSPAGRGEDRRA